MRSSDLPPMSTLAEQIDLLCATGNQFTPADREASWEQLPNITMAASDKPVLYDARMLAQIPTVIAPASRVYNALRLVRRDHATYKRPLPLVSDRADGLILGFSGYATGGRHSYEEEYAGIAGILDHCEAEGIAIEVVVDGGTGFGVPGLSGALAKERGLPTIGYAPLRGLRGAAPRDKLIVVGEEFGDEAKALGRTPDVLIVLGGGPNAQKEIEAAMTVGSLVLLLNLKEYRTDSVAYLPSRHERARQAQSAGKLAVCESVDDVAETLAAYDRPEHLALRKWRQIGLDLELAVTS